MSAAEHSHPPRQIRGRHFAGRVALLLICLCAQLLMLSHACFPNGHVCADRIAAVDHPAPSAEVMPDTDTADFDLHGCCGQLPALPQESVVALERLTAARAGDADAAGARPRHRPTVLDHIPI